MNLLKKPRRLKWTKRAQREFFVGLVMASPYIIGVLAFLAYPMLSSLYYSFTKYEIPLPPKWLGFDNYSKMFTRDRFFPKSLWNSFYLTAIGIPLQLIFALFCAMLLNLKVKGQAVWRTIYVLPTLMPAVAMAILWTWIMNPKLGIVNHLFSLVGIKGPLWFTDPAWAKPAIILMQIWGVGFTTILYLAALQGVPVELYESAEIDGANSFRKFYHITVPMISAVTLFQLITGILWSLQFFTGAYIIGGGGSTPGRPQGSLLFYALYLYIQAFEYLRMGYASALAWVLFVIAAVVTWVLLRTSERWTYYDVV